MSMANEAERVDGWRGQRFLRMGFPPTMADMLMRWNVSPGDVEPLVEAGCPFHLVMRIVRPLEAPAQAEADLYSVKV